MQEITQKEIKENALRYHEGDAKWHFHVLTPSCKFNPKKSYAFVLEGPEGNFINYSDEPASELGKELAPLAHKADVLSGSAESTYQPSPEVERMIERAKELNQRKVEWHHHVTFKGWQFHKGSSNYTLLFEDPERDHLESHSDEEPINDLKQIEPLFYSQHREKS